MALSNKIDIQRVVGAAPGGRLEGDFYATPATAVEKLLQRVDFTGQILEPCCGNGAISDVLKTHGHCVVSRDLHDWGYGEVGVDFLGPTGFLAVPNVITNPPFKLSTQFAERALQCTEKAVGRWQS